MKRLTFLAAINIAFSLHSNGQIVQNYISNNFQYVGKVNNNNLYRYRDVNNPIDALDNSLYAMSWDGTDKAIFKLFKQQERDKRTIYIDDSLNVYIQNKILHINYKQKDHRFEGIKINRSRGFTYNHLNNEIYLSVKISSEHYQIVQFDLKSEKEDMEPLALMGFNPIYSNGYLYFSSYHLCDWYSTFSEDVYRVKIGDWDNPELVLENVDPQNWFIIPETNIIYADILEEKANGILYNAETRKYAIIDAIYSNRVIEYNSKLYYELRPNDKPISYKEVKIPESFQFEDTRELCPKEKKKHYNLSNDLKPFSDTFITDELLYDADEQELAKLNKKELRLLRNAFFARQGYAFKSSDLQEFFSKFEWYNQLLSSYKVLEIGNENVVLSRKDKERVKIITEIENRK